MEHFGQDQLERARVYCQGNAELESELDAFVTGAVKPTRADMIDFLERARIMARGEHSDLQPAIAAYSTEDRPAFGSRQKARSIRDLSETGTTVEFTGVPVKIATVADEPMPYFSRAMKRMAEAEKRIWSFKVFFVLAFLFELFAHHNSFISILWSSFLDTAGFMMLMFGFLSIYGFLAALSKD